jgi:hypothetical protein
MSDKSNESEVMIIALVSGSGWCVMNALNMTLLQGPYDSHKDAKEAAETRSYRVQKGWAP